MLRWCGAAWLALACGACSPGGSGNGGSEAAHAARSPAGGAPIALTPDQVHVRPGSLAASLHPRLHPAAPRATPEEPREGGTPEHVWMFFNADSFDAGHPARQRQVLVYPADGWRKLAAARVPAGAGAAERAAGTPAGDSSPPAPDPAEALRRYLDAPGAGPIPILPAPPGGQLFAVQVKRLRFKGGHGVRCVTQYQQALGPVANERIFYTFQGLTDDGRYMVTVFHPERAKGIPLTALDAFWPRNSAWQSPRYTAYLDSTVRRMQKLKPEDFTPGLKALDHLVESIRIGQ
ncbi:MAG: hypothetical protein HZB25_06540 [Candidatus Eisenbacteria bacterium]|nr:hypothetical protein [Candidatus Eisenbacteria bacterium]